jgi:hypothetical protein
MILRCTVIWNENLPWTTTLHLCRSVFPSVCQYTAKCVLRTAVITSFICRYSSVKCISSKPCFRVSLHVTHSEHRMILQVYNLVDYHLSILSLTDVMFTYIQTWRAKRNIIFWIFFHEYLQKISHYQTSILKSWLMTLHRMKRQLQYLVNISTDKLSVFPYLYTDILKPRFHWIGKLDLRTDSSLLTTVEATVANKI